MPLGICPLCLGQKELVDSHFIPAAAYKPLYATGLPVNEPMVMTSKRVFQSSRQIKAQTFCEDCEDQFNKGGESWVLDKLATLTDFPLREMVIASGAVFEEPDFRAFSCDCTPGFKVEKLVHFAVGIFWKSAACKWNMSDGPVNRIVLGPYEEPIRQFVHGSAPFPMDVCLVTYLDSSLPPLIAITPPRQFKSKSFHLFGFYINGLQCLLCVGKQAPIEFTEACIASGPGHPVFLVPDAGNKMFAVLKPFTKNSKLSKNIRKTFEQGKTRQGKE